MEALRVFNKRGSTGERGHRSSTRAAPGDRARSATRFGPHAAVPLALVVGALGLCIAAWLRFHEASTSACPTMFSPDVWPTGGLAAVIGAFLLGGLLGNLPHKRLAGAYGLLTELGLLAFVAIVALAWGYETHALASESASTPPLTFFVMCARLDENDWTLVVFILASLLAGRWLWHRPGAYLP